MYINYQRAIGNPLNWGGFASVLPKEVEVGKITQHFNEAVIFLTIFFIGSDCNL